MNLVSFVKNFTLAFSLFYSLTSSAQTLYLAGGALKICSSLAPKNCIEKTSFSSHAKTHSLYLVNETAITAINSHWPNTNTQHKIATRKLLNKIKSKHTISKAELIDKFKSENAALYRALSNQEYYFVFDMLELPLIVKNKRISEQVLTQKNKVKGTTEILNAISLDIKNAPNKTLFLVTASSRDPYESADFYNGLFSQYKINAKWLALTPALAKAIAKQDCENLDHYRNKINLAYNRDTVYPDLTAQEKALCDAGIDNLITTLKNADGLFFNGGDQSLTKQVFINAETKEPYPWFEVIQSREILVGTSAGTAMQSGGQNNFGNVPMITNGSSLNALKNGAFDAPPPAENCQNQGGCQHLEFDTLTYDKHGGLGSFDFGILDTHFSERGRTPRLAVLMQATKQKFGFGVDETTALKVEKSTGNMSVIGKEGVVILEHTAKNTFRYHFMPTGEEFMLSRLKQEKSDDVKAISGEENVFENAISNGQIRRALQDFCNSKKQAITLVETAQKDTPVTFTKDANTTCVKSHSGTYRIENMLMRL
ncbi:cyanophycinase [Pseudoalteromonas spongiae]|uniref:cyanophycinase n=1 Tax=Pseudoalteromonas spongiae TaxID=298657 RepID=UPI00110A9CE8|nr:cyanophycinase [Pseudoalteromonas spongiae]TMO87096.1 cyanophycinase [Pseudoalteromonas spongiae]